MALPAASAIARRALADSRVRTIAFAWLFAAVGYANVVGYRSAYPTPTDRIALVRSLGSSDALRLFYGKPYDLLTVGGYAAWRVAGVLSIFAGVWGLLAAVRALRAEEEAGRTELLLTGIVGRRGAYLAALAAIAAGIALLWLATFLGLAAARLPVGGSAFLALTIVSVVPVFVGIGALASQLAPTRRVAIELSCAALLVVFVLRVVADTSAQLAWLRWLTPLGWAEELRPFTGGRPAVLLLPVGAGALLVAAAGSIALRRDVGTGVLATRERAAANLRLLSSPTAQALRGERASLAAWLIGSCFFAFIVGVISTSISSAGLSAAVRRQLHKVAGVSIVTPAGYIGFTFLFFVLVLSLFACSQLAAARGAETDQQLEALFALPVSRRGWLAGRLLLAAVAIAVIALATGVSAWAGAAVQHAGVTLPQMLAAGANCIPTALLFLGLGALVYAAVPRASAGISYGLVAVAFVWQLFGSVLGAPHWLLDLSPFRHVGLVPAQSFRAAAAAIMLVIAVAGASAALSVFRRRDLIGV
jgi:ABC-2 type transport system permease protein